MARRGPLVLNRLTLIVALSFAAGCTAPPVEDRPAFEPTRPAKVAEPPIERSALAILADFAAAWRGAEEHPLDEGATIAVWVDGEGYTVRLSDNGGRLATGAPAAFDWGYETDIETLRRIDAGSLNALTAMGQARASDPIPLRPRLPGPVDADAIRGEFIPLTMRFWNRSWPETAAFGEGATRNVHGAETAVLVYAEGLRSAWYQVKPGMRVNADPQDQVNDFDTAIVVTKGEFSGKLDGVDRIFREGEIVFIPAGMAHEFYAGEKQYGEFIILMYGDGA